MAQSPAVTSQPRSGNVLLYQEASFGVMATGAAPLSYQWLKDSVAIGGATNDQLIISSSRFPDAGAYSVVISNAQGVATSTNAVLNVRSPVGGDVDCSFAYGSTVTSTIRRTLVQPDGRILIAGGFGTVNGSMFSGVARLNPDGSTDRTFVTSLGGTDWTVDAIALQPDGKIVIGGLFASVSGVSRNGIARLNADGTLDTTFLNGMSGVGGAYPWVEAVAIQGDGKILIGGLFSSVNGVSRWRLARLHPDGSLDNSFLEGMSGPNSQVNSILVQNDNKIVIGGYFTYVNDSTCSLVARLDSSGNLDTNFQAVVDGHDPHVRVVTLQNDGKYLIGGQFTTVSGSNRARVARLENNGSLDTNFLAGLTGASDPIHTLAVQPDGKVVVGGGFTNVNGVPRFGIARLTETGHLDTGFQNGQSGVSSPQPYGSIVYAIALQNDGQIIIGGEFGRVNGEPRTRIARLTPDGALDEFRHRLVGADNFVKTITELPGGKLLVGGNFVTAHDIPRAGIVRLYADGSVDTNFLNGMAGVRGQVNSIAMQSDGKILLGGSFAPENGNPGLARLNADGTRDNTSLSGLSSLGSSVTSVVLQPDDKIVIGGYFTSVNGVTRGRIARLNPNGSLDTTFMNGLSGANAVVESMILQPDGKIIVGGGFTSVNDTNRSNIARLNPDGSLDTGFVVVLTGPSATVTSLALSGDGKILIAGYFTSVNGTIRYRIARLNANGSLDTGFQNGQSGVNGPVYALALAYDGKVLLGGSFEYVNGALRQSIARLNANGTLDTTFMNGLAGLNYADVVTALSDGKVMVGGSYNSVNNLPVRSIARLWGNNSIPPLIKNISKSTASANLTWYSVTNRTYRVQYVRDPAAPNWTNLPGDVFAVGATANKSDFTTSTNLSRHYRVVLLP